MAEARHRDQMVIRRRRELDIAHLERRQELDMTHLAMHNILPKKNNNAIIQPIQKLQHGQEV